MAKMLSRHTRSSRCCFAAAVNFQHLGATSNLIAFCIQRMTGFAFWRNCGAASVATWNTERMMKASGLKRQLRNPFTVTIWSLKTRLMPNFRVSFSHRRSTIASLETKPFIQISVSLQRQGSDSFELFKSHDFPWSFPWLFLVFHDLKFSCPCFRVSSDITCLYFILSLLIDTSNNFCTTHTIIFHAFPYPTIKFHDFPGLETEILKFHDFPGFTWPVRTLKETQGL